MFSPISYSGPLILGTVCVMESGIVEMELMSHTRSVIGRSFSQSHSIYATNGK